MKDRGPEIRAKWDLIPEGLDILIVHGPPKTYRDTSPGVCFEVGCADLERRLQNMHKHPKHLVCGHVHGGYGTSKFIKDACEFGLGKGIDGPLPVDYPCMIHNVSFCNEAYQGVNPPIVLEI